MTVVLKLGGSVITRKDDREVLDEENLATVADAIAAATGELVVVHGGGSFGHPAAADHGITRTRGSHDAPGALAVHDAMKRLNDAVLERLHARDVPALPVHPLSAGVRDESGSVRVFTDQIDGMLAEGFVPVVHGDVLCHRDRGVTIVSGDELVAVIGTALAADRVGMCTGVPGVLDDTGSVIPVIETYEDAADALGESAATDVTGGMAAKVEALLELDAPARVFGVADLPAFLDGEAVGTRVG